jgi:hypothetical protein
MRVLPLAVACCAFDSLKVAPGPLRGRGTAIVGEKQVALGASGLSISSLGIGTWSWGNQLLWGYDQRNDAQLQVVHSTELRLLGDSYSTL